MLMVTNGEAYGLQADLDEMAAWMERRGRAYRDATMAMNEVDEEEQDGAYASEHSGVTQLVGCCAAITRALEEDRRGCRDEGPGGGAEGACRSVLHATEPCRAGPRDGSRDSVELTRRLNDDCDQVICATTLRNERVHVRASVLEGELADNEEIKELGKEVRKVQRAMFQDENDHEEMARICKIWTELNGRIRRGESAYIAKATEENNCVDTIEAKS